MYLIGIIIILFTILMMRSAEDIKGFTSFFKEFWILVAPEKRLHVNTAVKILPVFTQQHPIMIYWGKKHLPAVPQDRATETYTKSYQDLDHQN